MNKIIMLMILLISPVFSYEAKVVKVRSGSYIHVITNNNTNEIKIKLWGIDAPDSAQKHSYESMMFLSNMIYNKTIEVEEVFNDPFGRPHAIITFNSNIINNIQIKNGNVVTYFLDKTHRDLQLKWKIDEAEAKMNKIGLWMYNQITPYEHRIKQLQTKK